MKRPNVFYGWWIALVAALAGLIGPIPIVVFSFGVFLPPLAREFHADRAAIALAFSFNNLAVAGACPLVGWLTDRYGARKVILPCTVAVGVILISANLLAPKIMGLYAFYLGLGLASSGVAPVPYGKIVSRWFDRHRGLALGLMMGGIGLGAVVMPPVEQRLIATFGWRAAYAIPSVPILLVTLPAVALFLKERPEEMGLLPDGGPQVSVAAPEETSEPGLSWHDTWHTGTFWRMLCAYCLAGASAHACFIHLPAMLAGRGATEQAAALGSSVLGVGLLAGRFGSGYLLDRFFAPYVAAVLFGGLGFGIALLRLTSTPEVSFLAALLVGLGLGTEGDVIAYLTSRYFGLRSFGKIYAYNFAAFIVAGALGAYLMGAGFDWTGSYATPLVAFLIATLLAVKLMLSLGPYRYGVKSPHEIEPAPAMPQPEL